MTTRWMTAARYLARRDGLAEVSRCTQCGQWTWQGRCTLHPDAPQDTY